MSTAMCPNHPERKATFPTLKGHVCDICFFEQRAAKREAQKGKAVVVTKAQP